MQPSELYRLFQQRIHALAEEAAPRDVWSVKLRAILDEFQSSAAMLKPGYADLLCKEFCRQLEREAVLTRDPGRRELLLTAVKWLLPSSLPPEED
jgi:hypothetical protein